MWIKVRKDLRYSAKVVTVASRIGVPPIHAFGAIVQTWMLADDGADKKGFIKHLTFDHLNKMIGMEKLGEAMEEVGWIKQGKGGLTFVNYTEHNGSTSKKRIDDAERQRKCRANKKAKEKKESVTGVTGVTENCDKPVTREEKRREEKRIEEVEEDDQDHPSSSSALMYAEEMFPRKENLRIILPSLQKIIERWHLERSACGWMTRFNQPIKNWKADLILYAARWASNHQDDLDAKPKENYMPKL